MMFKENKKSDLMSMKSSNSNNNRKENVPAHQDQPTQWSLPNDRELMIRAKLKTGWSSRTHTQLPTHASPSIPTSSLFAHNRPSTQSAISELEFNEIESVLQRAKQVENKELTRITKLYERFEYINRPQGNGTTTCYVCGTIFGTFSMQPRMCNICTQNCCVTCSVDTSGASKQTKWICKICSEYREFYKKSGAWFHKHIPLSDINKQRILLHASKAKNTSVSSTGNINKNSDIISINDASSIDASLSSGGLSAEFINAKQKQNSKSHHPQQQQHHHNNGERKTNQSIEDDDVYTDDDEHIEDENDYSENIYSIDNLVAHTIGEFDANTSSAVNNNGNLHSTAINLKHQQKLFETNSISSVTDATMMSDTKSIHKSDIPNSPNLVNKSSPLPVRSSNTANNNNNNNNNNSYIELSKMKSIQNYLASTNYTNTNTNENNNNKNANSSNSASPNMSRFRSRGTDLGSIRFTVIYNSSLQQLKVNLLNASNLPPRDSNGLSDPYIKLHLLPSLAKSTKLRSKTVYKNLNPQFNETLVYDGVSIEDLSTKILRLTVLDEDKFGYDDIGEYRLPLKILQIDDENYFDVRLDAIKELGDDLNTNYRGKINFSLKYCKLARTLYVKINRCTQLLPMDNGVSSDPYVQITLVAPSTEKANKCKHKTSIKWKTLDPEYNEEFRFDNIDLKSLIDTTIVISVWDKDITTSDYIGCIKLGRKRSGDELTHFFTMIKNPDMYHGFWHELKHDDLSM